MKKNVKVIVVNVAVVGIIIFLTPIPGFVATISKNPKLLVGFFGGFFMHLGDVALSVIPFAVIAIGYYLVKGIITVVRKIRRV